MRERPPSETRMAPLRLDPGVAQHEQGEVDDVIDRAQPPGRDDGPKLVGRLAG